MIEGLSKDLKEFESDTTNPNNIEAFSEDYFKTMNDIEQRYVLIKESQHKKLDNLAKKYDETKPETVNVDAMIKDMDKDIESMFGFYKQETQEFLENSREGL